MKLSKENKYKTDVVYGDIIELHYNDPADGEICNIGIVSRVSGVTRLIAFDGGSIDFGSESKTVFATEGMASFVSELDSNKGHYSYNHYSQNHYELKLVEIEKQTT